MSRTLSNESSFEHLKREAKRWLRALRENDAAARARFDRSITKGSAIPTLRDVQHALALEHAFDGWTSLSAAVARIEQTRDERARVLTTNAALALPALPENPNSARDEIVARFLLNACRDWRVGGGREIPMSLHTASRLLQQHPDIARENIYTAVVCGELELVRQFVQADISVSSRSGGPRNWPPLLYLVNARLLQSAVSAPAVEIARVLLDNDADPNVYCPGGAAVTGYDENGFFYTALTCAVGRGEPQAPAHPHVQGLATLLMERGAEPYDKQMLYNVFADHASRKRLTNDIVWLLELMHQHSLRLGRGGDWNDPAWNMLDVGGYGPGAFFLLSAAISAGQLRLAEWMLQHGAGPNTRASNPRGAAYSLYEQAFLRDDRAAGELLTRYGADTWVAVSMSAYENFVDAGLKGNHTRARELFEVNPQWRFHPHALLAATRTDNAEAVKFLLSLGISPDIEENKSNARALHAASFAGATRAAKVLLEAGADPDFREANYGATPMSIAAWVRDQAMTDLLAQYSRDLFSLVFAGKVSRVREVLLEDSTLAALIHPRNGESLLMCLPDDESAAVALAELLLANGADPSRRDASGATAREMAERRALLRVVAMFGD